MLGGEEALLDALLDELVRSREEVDWGSERVLPSETDTLERL